MSGREGGKGEEAPKWRGTDDAKCIPQRQTDRGMRGVGRKALFGISGLRGNSQSSRVASEAGFDHFGKSKVLLTQLWSLLKLIHSFGR